VILECRNFAAFYFMFSQCSTGIYQAFDRQTEFLYIFNFTILSYLWNSWKFDPHEKYTCFTVADMIASHCNYLLYMINNQRITVLTLDKLLRHTRCTIKSTNTTHITVSTMTVQ